MSEEEKYKQFSKILSMLANNQHSLASISALGGGTGLTLQKTSFSTRIFIDQARTIADTLAREIAAASGDGEISYQTFPKNEGLKNAMTDAVLLANAAIPDICRHKEKRNYDDALNQLVREKKQLEQDGTNPRRLEQIGNLEELSFVLDTLYNLYNLLPFIQGQLGATQGNPLGKIEDFTASSELASTVIRDQVDHTTERFGGQTRGAAQGAS